VKQPHRTLLLWVVLIVIGLSVWQFSNAEGARRRPIPFSEFMALVSAPPTERHVTDVEVKGREYAFRVEDPKAKGQAERGVTIGPESEDIATEILKHQVRVTYQKDEASPLLTTTLTILVPMLFLLVLFYLFMRQLQAGGGKAMSFGKSRARLLTEAQNKINFSDVAGIDEAKDEVEEIIAFLKDPKKFQR
jgi:cell division protease FtsH